MDEKTDFIKVYWDEVLRDTCSELNKHEQGRREV